MTADNKTRIAFFGTPDFATTILAALIDDDAIDIVAVVTNPDRPAGRSSAPQAPPVKILAQKHGLDIYQPSHANDTAVRETLEYLQPDLFVVAAYGFILPEALLGIPKHGALNVHPSLLPAYRGPSPIPAAIDAGDDKTGVTIMLMDETMDHGPILAQKNEDIRNDDTSATLTERLAQKGADLLRGTISRWIAGDIEAENQEHNKATYTKLLTKNDGRIDWSDTAKAIERHVRAFQPWPGAWSTLPDGKRLKIITVDDHPRTHPEPGDDDDADMYDAGTMIKYNGEPCVVTGSGIIALVTVQPEGKNPMDSKDFLNGYQHFLGKQLRAEDQS